MFVIWQFLLAWNAVRVSLTVPAAAEIWGRLAGRRGFVTFEKNFIIKKWTICNNSEGTKRTIGPAAGSSVFLHSTRVICSPSIPSARPAAAVKLKTWSEFTLVSCSGRDTDVIRHSGPHPSLVWQCWTYIRNNFGTNICTGFHSNETDFPSEVRLVK